MKHIETEIWVPNPENPDYLMLERKKTYSEVFQELVQVLKEQGVYNELERFTNMISGKKEVFEPYHCIACYAIPGGNEGHIIHIESMYEDKSKLIFSGKTFCGLEHALKVANVCTQAFYR